MNALRELRPLTYEDFAGEHVLVAAAERDLQVAIQAALDIGSSILAGVNAGFPQTYSDIFPSLGDLGVLPADFAARLANMAKFRNVLVHLYVEVDTALVYRYIQENLEDFEVFARYVSTWLEEHGAEGP
ncbi:MAG: DUF86 domain-containing protein [Anaerolineae bacterium]|nr:DUF86 domain-containing protein [Anaerolineae bacterium]